MQKIVHTKILDERGRCTSKEELSAILMSSKDPYDKRKLAYWLGHITGLRPEDYCKARFSWFDKTLLWMKMDQCKAKRVIKNGVISLKSKPKHVPIPLEFAEYLRAYINFRLMCMVYTGQELEDFRLFPGLTPQYVRNWLYKLRVRHGDKLPFLLDVYKIEETYLDGELKAVKKFYRIAPYCGRSYYCTAAADVAGGDPFATRLLTGHDKVDHAARYTKILDLVEKKEEIMRRHLTGIMPPQLTPVLVGQKRLIDY